LNSKTSNNSIKLAIAALAINVAKLAVAIFAIPIIATPFKLTTLAILVIATPFKHSAYKAARGCAANSAS
jgi:hypothetical protein